MYIHGLNQQKVEPEGTMTWLDFLIMSNPQGVMKVLSSYGYTGYLAPQDENEMYEVCLDLMDKYGDQIVIDLLKSHPMYGVISDICKEETKVTIPFKNASGQLSGIVTTIQTINYKKLIGDVLIIIGAIYLTGKLWHFINSKDEAS